ncbi:DUF6000 family protein [Streptomyces olivochromogenes]|uniref:DUF6000 family protein n=1 Tax=Streptomyces olivochromogenes TaxID=1963 RepID=UPI003687E1E8
MNTCRISLPAGRNGAERCTRSCRGSGSRRPVSSAVIPSHLPCRGCPHSRGCHVAGVCRFVWACAALPRDGSPGREVRLGVLSEDAGVVTANAIATFLVGGWRKRRSAAWLVAVSRRTEFRERLGDLLPAGEVCSAGLAHCVALSSFGTPRDADLAGRLP